MSSPILLLLLLLLSALSASALISDDHQVVNQQADDVPEKRCLIKFENLNYTIIKGKCKEPYSYDPCCDAFKSFACPFLDYINDNTTTCADDMFDSLQALGNFPTDLFVRMCRDLDDDTIISCPAPPPLDQNATAVAPPPPIIFMLQLFIPLLFFNFSNIRV